MSALRTILVAATVLVSPLMHRSQPVNIDGDTGSRIPAPVTKPKPRTSHAAGGSGTSSTWAASGGATWYVWRPGEAAAGPLLRRMLGASWRGSVVRVYANGKHTVVKLTDWCACGDRNGVPTLIDLDVRSFSILSPKSAGVIRVVVRP